MELLERTPNKMSILEELLERELTMKVAKLKFQYFGHMMRGCAGEFRSDGRNKIPRSS